MRILALLAAAAASAQTFPPLNYKVDAKWPDLPVGSHFMETAGVAVDALDNVYVFHRGRQPLMQFSPSGKFLRGWGDGLSDRPHSVRIDPEGNIWAVDDGSHTILKMDTSGRIRMVLGRYRANSEAKPTMPEPTGIAEELRGVRDEGVIRFFRPTDIAFGPDGAIYVSDGYGNSRVVKFAKDGRFLKAWGKRGHATGEFHTPHSIAVGRDGKVYVADRENYRIQIFDAEGKYLTEWKNIGSPWGLALTRDGHMMMADGYNSRVVKLTLDGKVMGAFGSHGRQPGQFHYCHQLAVDSRGNVYTAEILNWRPQKFTPGQ
ncbi:MAG: hypothetical protein FJW39_16415 [Acidobacteria bacterium]|nr:hypothetical protein [Acidobacteriota bacterium]